MTTHNETPNLANLAQELEIKVELANWDVMADILKDDAHLLTLQPRIRDGNLLVIHDNDYHALWFDYGDNLYINPVLVEWAKNKNAYWDWQTPSALVLIFEN